MQSCRKVRYKSFLAGVHPAASHSLKGRHSTNHTSFVDEAGCEKKMDTEICQKVRCLLEAFDPLVTDLGVSDSRGSAFSIGGGLVCMMLLCPEDAGETAIKYRILVSEFELAGVIVSDETCKHAVHCAWRALFGASLRCDLDKWCENRGDGFAVKYLRQTELSSTYAFGPGSGHFGVAVFYKDDGSMDFCVRFNGQLVFTCEQQRSTAVRRLVVAALDRVARGSSCCAIVI